jgi:hypothetical protein
MISLMMLLPKASISPTPTSDDFLIFQGIMRDPFVGLAIPKACYALRDLGIKDRAQDVIQCVIGERNHQDRHDSVHQKHSDELNPCEALTAATSFVGSEEDEVQRKPTLPVSGGLQEGQCMVSLRGGETDKRQKPTLASTPTRASKRPPLHPPDSGPID